MSDRDVLRNSWLFSTLDREELDALAAAGAELPLAAGDVVLTKDKPNDSLYFVIQGEVQVKSGPKSPSSIAVLREGDVFGEMSWLDGQPASSWVVCGTPKATLYRVPFVKLDAMLSRFPEAHVQVLRKFAINLSYRLRG